MNFFQKIIYYKRKLTSAKEYSDWFASYRGIMTRWMAGDCKDKKLSEKIGEIQNKQREECWVANEGDVAKCLNEGFYPPHYTVYYECPECSWVLSDGKYCPFCSIDGVLPVKTI